MARSKTRIAALPVVAPDIEEAIDENVGDDLLRLVLIACHPVLSSEARIALTLRLLGGLTTPEIARAFLAPEPTIAQRIVRAKRTLTEARVPFEVPRGAELTARLASVLGTLYLIFNEGYTATGGERWMRPELCEEALRLGRILAELAPREAEVHGLVALMEIQASRLRARVGPGGRPILLLDQDRALWDQLLVRRGLSALERAEALAEPLGPYALQAAIAGCHARARTAEATDWPRIVALYDALVEVTGSPVVELNRAVAISMAFGPAAALELRRRAARSARTRVLSSPTERSRRSAREARTPRRSARGARASGRPHRQRARTRAPPRTRAGLQVERHPFLTAGRVDEARRGTSL